MRPGQLVNARLVYASPAYLSAREAAGALVVLCNLREDIPEQGPGRFEVLPGAPHLPFVQGGFISTPVPSGEAPTECWTCGRTETWAEAPTEHGPTGHGVIGCPYCDE